MSGKKRTKKLLVFSLSYFLVGAVFFIGGLVANRRDVEKVVEVPAGKVKLLSATQPKGLDFSLFWEAWRAVDENYSGKLDNRKRIEGAIQGMMLSLDDPYSVYLGPSSNKLFLEDLDGRFDGIGAQLEVRKGLITVVAPLEGSPAERAGIKAQDVIVKIDGKEANKMNFDDAVLKIRGKKGTTVTLTILRPEETETREISIVRDTIEVKSVKLSYVGPNNSIAVLKINQFGTDTLSLIKSTALEIKKKDIKGIIVDVRNNPGGYLDTAVRVASLFIPNDTSRQKNDRLKRGVIVIERDKSQKTKEYTRNEDQLFSLPVVVLQNRGSASAAEIFAGALGDYQVAKIVGQTSFGKGSVQTLKNLSNEGGVKITIAKWFTPLDRTIDGQGLDPDVKIEAADDTTPDPYIEKAVEILTD